MSVLLPETEDVSRDTGDDGVDHLCWLDAEPPLFSLCGKPLRGDPPDYSRSLCEVCDVLGHALGWEWAL